MSTKENSIKKNDINVQTFVFDNCNREMPPSIKLKSNLWQILPIALGSLLCLPYGIMLGWPSPTYPKLLAETTPIPITIDQSAMIAGFLMIGNILGTPLSSWTFLGNKYGMMLGIFSMIIGWIIMWFATNIFFLLGSRFMVGLGFGYSCGQLKVYIKDLCKPSLAGILTKLINSFIFLGVIVAFILGCFVTFQDFSLVAIIITTVIFLISMLLPHTPKEYLKNGKISHARTMITHIKPSVSVEREIQNLNIALESHKRNMSFFQVLRDEKLRGKFFVIALLTFFMQFSGAPSTVVYSQIIFSASETPFPEFCAIFYSVLFFASNLLGTFYFSKLNKKTTLLISTISLILALILNIAVLYFDFNFRYWRYSALVSMSLYCFCHSIGLAVTPFFLVAEYLPEKARKVVSHFQIMQHSALALIITKIFQVLYDRFALYVPFCLYLSIAFIGLLFIVTFVPSKGKVDTKSRIGPT